MARPYSISMMARTRSERGRLLHELEVEACKAVRNEGVESGVCFLLRVIVMTYSWLESHVHFSWAMIVQELTLGIVKLLLC